MHVGGGLREAALPRIVAPDGAGEGAIEHRKRAHLKVRERGAQVATPARAVPRDGPQRAIVAHRAYGLPLVRPSRLVVGSVLTAALAMVALPGLAGSRVPTQIEPIPAGAFQQLNTLAIDQRSTASIGPLDAAHVSEATIGVETAIVEPGAAPDGGPSGRVHLDQPDPGASSIQLGAREPARPGSATRARAAVSTDPTTNLWGRTRREP